MTFHDNISAPTKECFTYKDQLTWEYYSPCKSSCQMSSVALKELCQVRENISIELSLIVLEDDKDRQLYF